MLIVLGAVVLALVAPAPAGAAENFADEPPFGGTLPPPLVKPPSVDRPPPGFELSANEAIAIADRAQSVSDERVRAPGCGRWLTSAGRRGR